MTTWSRFPERSHDQQDGTERHVWGEQEYIENGGSIVRVRGTDTIDEEAAVLNIGGVSFNLPKNSNTEVVLLSGGSDTNLKFAILTIPRDKQRKWDEGNGGIQNPTDPTKALEFNGKRTWITEGNAAIGPGGTVEVRDDGTVIIRGKLIVEEGIETTGGVNASGGFNSNSGLKVSRIDVDNIYSNHGHSGADSPAADPTTPPGFDP